MLLCSPGAELANILKNEAQMLNLQC
jgi:hypothetical protein